MKLHLIIIFLSCLFLYSCSASSDVKINSDISYQELKTRVNENSKKLQSLDADGEISIDSPDISDSGSITVSIKKPDSVYTKLEGPFGIDIADLLITRENFIYYKPRDNTVIRGPSNSYYLGIIMKIKIEFDDIINAFSGKFIFNDEIYDEENISIENGKYLITLKKDNEYKKFWINPENFYVTKLGTYEFNGETKIEILYENFYEKDGIYFPKNITITRPKEKQNIWLTYSSETFNNEKLTYKMRIPKSAKEINWNGE